MRCSIISLAIGLLPAVFAAPLIEKRALTSADVSVLQLALYLEHLEFNLYSSGFNNFSDAQYIAAGFPPGFRANVGLIASVCVDERPLPDVVANNPTSISMNLPISRRSRKCSRATGLPQFRVAHTNSRSMIPRPLSHWLI